MSKEKKVLDRKKSDKKSKIIFIVVMVCVLVGGFFGGYFAAAMGDFIGVGDIAQAAMDMLNSESYYIGGVVSIFAGMIAFVLYRQSRKAYESWDDEDDEVMDKIEEKLSLAVIITNGSLLLTEIVTTIGIAQIQNFQERGGQLLLKIAILIGGMFLSWIITWVLTAKVVKFEKELNPEKKGSLYDFNFQKKWMESSDEAEKLVTYKCGFAAYKAVNTACSVLWLICMYGMVVWHWDNVPVLMVGAVWLTSYLSYSKEALKLSKNASKIQE